MRSCLGKSFLAGKYIYQCGKPRCIKPSPKFILFMADIHKSFPVMVVVYGIGLPTSISVITPRVLHSFPYIHLASPLSPMKSP